MKFNSIGSFLNLSSGGDLRAGKVESVGEIASRLDGLKIQEKEYDQFIATQEKEVQNRHKWCKRFVKLTDGTAKTVKPLAIGSLIGMGFNPLWGLGLMGAIGALAVAFAFRGKLGQENVNLGKAESKLRELKDLRFQIEQEKKPYEKKMKEAEWIKKAAEVDKMVDEDSKGIRIDKDKGTVMIGGIALNIQKRE